MPGKGGEVEIGRERDEGGEQRDQDDETAIAEVFLGFSGSVGGMIHGGISDGVGGIRQEQNAAMGIRTPVAGVRVLHDWPVYTIAAHCTNVL
ncbi:MAG: hypothetical protein PWR16_1185 [Methanoculleus sp.]|nr:hypothetical protein [Methanoculleus sp.]